MKIVSALPALPLLLVLLAPPALAGAAEHAHAVAADSHSAASAKPGKAAAAQPGKVAPARGWATDAPLRAGMGRIREAVAGLGHYERGHMGAEQAVALAADIEADVRFLIANCKLEPAADAALHGIIGQLLQGAHAIKTKPTDLSAIAPMRAALDEYARSFDDPAFRKVAAAD